MGADAIFREAAKGMIGFALLEKQLEARETGRV